MCYSNLNFLMSGISKIAGASILQNPCNSLLPVQDLLQYRKCCGRRFLSSNKPGQIHINIYIYTTALQGAVASLDTAVSGSLQGAHQLEQTVSQFHAVLLRVRQYLPCATSRAAGKQVRLCLLCKARLKHKREFWN